MRQAAEEAKQAAEAEHEQQRKSRRIYANQEKMRLHLEQESARLDDALHTDMQKKHGEIRTWYRHFACLVSLSCIRSDRPNLVRNLTRCLLHQV
jgi:hypothetical protein